MDLDGGVGTNAVHSGGVCQSVQVVVASLTHSGNDHSIVFVVGQFVDDIPQHSVVGSNACQHAICAGNHGSDDIVGDVETADAV